METAEKTLAEQFKDGLDQDGAVKLAERVKELEAKTANMDDAMARESDATTRVLDLQEQLEKLTKERDEWADNAVSTEAKFKDGLDKDGAALLTKERDDLADKLATVTKKLEEKPKSVAVKETASKLRKFKDIAAFDQPDRDALRALVAASEDVEIALIDDKGREVAGSKPLTVKGDVWRQHTLGLMQSEPVEITGDGPAFSFVGYALVVDGKHVANSWRSEPVNVTPGATIKLENDIVF